jgi:hypothetical protein
VKDGHSAAAHLSSPLKDYRTPAGTTLMLLNGEPLINFVQQYRLTYSSLDRIDGAVDLERLEEQRS